MNIGLLAMGLVVCTAVAAVASPWDMKVLRKAPQFTVEKREGGLCSIYYEGIPYKGKPTRVFAYLAYPEKIEGKAPAVVLVHGGGGAAFAGWAKAWAARGYVALAMDQYGNGPDGQRMADGCPMDFWAGDPGESWINYAVADVILGTSLVASLPEVDPKRIGMTGISWGGFLTCIISGLDDRLKATVPVYGCGYVYEAASFAEIIQGLPEKQRDAWIENFDPSKYLGRAKMPMLFINGTNDAHYWLNSFQMSYQLVRKRAVCVKVRMPHSHEDGWAPVEIGLFMDQHLRGGVPLASISAAKCENGTVTAKFVSKAPIASAQLNYTTDPGHWRDRKWESVEAKISGSQVTGVLPAARPITYFVSITDDRGAIVTTEHVVVER